MSLLSSAVRANRSRNGGSACLPGPVILDKVQQEDRRSIYDSLASMSLRGGERLSSQPFIGVIVSSPGALCM